MFQNLTPYIPAAAQVAQELILPDDPRKRVEVLKAQIANTKRTMRNMPGASVVFGGRLRKLQAKLRAAQAELTLREESERSTRVFRYAGWAAAGLGVLMLLGGALWALGKGRRSLRIPASRQITG